MIGVGVEEGICNLKISFVGVGRVYGFRLDESGCGIVMGL